MKILYAIQGTGNGHMARAQEILPILNDYAKVDILLSGRQCELSLPYPIHYRLKGLGFIFGKNGGIDYKKTLWDNSLFSFMKEVRQLPVRQYDLVINDFEPVSAWAAKLKGVKCISISHQSAILHADAPKPRGVRRGAMFFMKTYAPAKQAYGFHFKELGDRITTPVIKNDIRQQPKEEGSHYTVYLPAYDDIKIIAFLARFRGIRWEVFSKHSRVPYSFQNIIIRPVNQHAFNESLTKSKGVFCTAGFETPAESLFLNKKLCVVPMHGQFEQQYNAAMLKSMGVTVINNLTNESEQLFQSWLSNGKPIPVTYPDNTRDFLERILEETCSYQVKYTPLSGTLFIPAR
jgi:uncharacterized protein (TIGR00661 family)